MPKIVDHEKMRATLMERAFGLFAEQGFHGVSMRDLGVKLEVSTGTLYHYFSNKNDLFAAMIQHLVQGDIQDVLGQIQELSQPQERIRAVLKHVSEKETYFHNLLFLLFDFYRTRQDTAEAPSPTASFFTESLRFYREAISENMGHLDERTAQMLISTIIGTLVQRILDPTALTLESMAPYMEALNEIHATN